MTTEQKNYIGRMVQRLRLKLNALGIRNSVVRLDEEMHKRAVSQTNHDIIALEAAINAGEQLSNITCHINTLIDQPHAEEIGATADREPHMRVMRILMDYNRLREDLEQVKKLLKGARVLQ